jgi:hypothetical protein
LVVLVENTGLDAKEQCLQSEKPIVGSIGQFKSSSLCSYFLATSHYFVLQRSITATTTMSAQRETESQRQVRQMVNFIMQEANEKVNEIKIKVIIIYLCINMRIKY